MFMCAKINSSVDETIRVGLLNKPWYFNLEQSMCVLCLESHCGMQCGAVLARPARRENNERSMMKKPKIKEGGVDVEACLRSHAMVV